jgi:hypothetical protein
MSAGGGVRPHAAVVGDDQLLSDLRAGRVARLGRARQCEPRPDQERLDRRDRDLERAGEVGVGHAAELAHQQRRALLIREPADVLDQTPDRLPQVNLGDRVTSRGAQQRQHLRRWRARPAQLVDAAIVGDPEQPGSERQLTIAGSKPRVGPDEHVLERVLGILAAREHLARVRQQALVVPIVDRSERFVVAGPEQRDELLVGAEAKQRRPEPDPTRGKCRWCLECGRFHSDPLNHSERAHQLKLRVASG